MPTILFLHGYRFYFFSNEGNEPPHIHVEKREANAKYWLTPNVSCAYCYGFNSKEEKEISSIVKEYKQFFIGKWNEYFS
jgi:hypothetical protein